MEMCVVHRPHRTRVSSTLPHRVVTNIFLLRSMSLPILPHVTKSERDIRPERKKTRKYISVEQTKTHYYLRVPMLAEVSNWHPLKLCCHLNKPSTIQRHREARSYNNDIRQHCVISYVFSYHIGGTCLVKEFSWSRDGAFFLGPKTGRDEHPYLKGAKVVTSQVVYEDRSSAKETYLQSFIKSPSVPPSRKW